MPVPRPPSPAFSLPLALPLTTPSLSRTSLSRPSLSRPSPSRPSLRACAATPSAPHISVLPSAVVDHLLPPASAQPQIFLDGTLGAGGHAALLLSSHRITHYIGLDRDPSALALARERLAPSAVSTGARLDFLRGDFRDAKAVLERAGLGDVVGNVAGCLLDVGVSSMQLDDGERGFSFMRDGPLDMRMDGSGADFARTAAEIVNGSSVEELEFIFREYGEQRGAKVMAERVIAGRPFSRTLELATALSGGAGAGRGKTHPATLCFQALRIAVNGELAALEGGVRGCVDVLRPGAGRLGVISFHSLEDRIVKYAFKEMSTEVGGVKIVTKRPVVADREEMKRNVRARSAKLRVCQRLQVDEVPVIGKVNKYAPDRIAS